MSSQGDSPDLGGTGAAQKMGGLAKGAKGAGKGALQAAKVAKAGVKVATIKAQLIKKAIQIGVPLVIALVIAIIFAIAGLFMVIFGSLNASANTCSTSGPMSLEVLATNGPVNVGSTYTYPSSPPSTGTITAERMGNAQAIVRAALQRNPPASELAITIALATALVESQLVNHQVATDHDSLGLFQQRPSQGWGTPEQITNPTYATNIFIDRLLKVPGWDTSMTPGTAAQKVQRSAKPDRYDKVMPTAAGLAQSILAAIQTAGTQTPASSGAVSQPTTSSTYILGDSITLQNKDKYTQLFTERGVSPTISAVSGRSWLTPGAGPSVGTPGTGANAVQIDKQTIASSGSIIIALGTNGGAASNPTTEIIDTIRSINPTAPIYWVNIAGTAPQVASRVTEFNNQLALHALGGRINLIDWASTVNPGGDGTADPNHLLSDGIHPSAVGATKLAEIITTEFDSIQGTLTSGCAPLTAGGPVDSSACPPDTFFNSTTYRSSGSAHDLCVKSVSQARSPEAQKAIMWAFNHVGIPYGRPDGVCSKKTTRTGPDYYDCSGFVTSAYSQTGTNVGGNPATAAMRSGWSQANQISADQARPGDLLLPSSGHVVMLLADNMIVHTNRCGDVSHVRTKYNGDFMRYYAIKTASAP